MYIKAEPEESCNDGDDRGVICIVSSSHQTEGLETGFNERNMRQLKGSPWLSLSLPLSLSPSLSLSLSPPLSLSITLSHSLTIFHLVAIRVAARWYAKHLGPQATVMLLTDDRANLAKAVGEGLRASTGETLGFVPLFCSILLPCPSSQAERQVPWATISYCYCQ